MHIKLYKISEPIMLCSTTKFNDKSYFMLLKIVKTKVVN